MATVQEKDACDSRRCGCERRDFIHDEICRRYVQGHHLMAGCMTTGSGLMKAGSTYMISLSRVESAPDKAEKTPVLMLLTDKGGEIDMNDDDRWRKG